MQQIKRHFFWVIVPLLVLFFLIIDLWLVAKYFADNNILVNSGNKAETRILSFASAQEFKDYLAAGERFSQNNLYYDTEVLATTSATKDANISMTDERLALSEEPERWSETNVQVADIDEPDIVKTNGNNIFFSPEPVNIWMWEEKQDTVTNNKTKIIDTLPIEDIKTISELNENGELLLSNDVLMVFAPTKISAYDISNAAVPKEKWKYDITSDSYYHNARILNNSLYLITKTDIQQNAPCPFHPLTKENQEITVSCESVYHPQSIIPSDITYTVMKIDPVNGEVLQNISFIGSANDSSVYMSADNIYVSFLYPGNVFSFIVDFFNTDGSNLISISTLNKINKLNEYDISVSSKFNEIQNILDLYYDSLSEEDRLNSLQKIEEAMQKYYKEHMRELEKTVITKIDNKELKIQSTAEVPGVILNQFSLDEYKSNLRVAVTVGSRGLLWLSSQDSYNDLYIFNEKMKQKSSYQNLGKDERIYSARFVGDLAYLVTFKETDPFFIFDLSNPNAPQLKGELKIPGYSSYLHPLAENRILGIGKENQEVKLSLFDVKNVTDPKEISHYLLAEEYWSDVLNNHHAFLQDPQKKVFFMPASQNGYIFSYNNSEIQLKKKIENISAKRGVFIDNYFYILGQSKIAVVDENTWEIIKELDL